MSQRAGGPRVLLGLTGLRIDGGIACVARCIVSALADRTAEGGISGVDRVLLLEDPSRCTPPPLRGDQWLARGSQLRFIWLLWRSWRRQHHELVLFDHVGLARAVQLPLPSFPPRRYAVFVHGLELDGLTEGSRSRGLTEAGIVLANSESTARKVRDRFPNLAARVRVVPLCLDPERVAAWEAAPPPEAEAPREQAVLVVGRMWAAQGGKGHDSLIEAWPAVRARVPAAALWIVGGGDDRPRLEAKARALDVADSVRFLGRVSDEELGRCYQRAAVFAMPSRQEGFGLVYAEAMWHGLPCIGSSADAAREVIQDGETGLLVPYGESAALADALVALLRDPERSARMGAAARRRAREHFGYERFRRDLLAALELA